MKVYIFNPENDMALADGSPNYKAPAGILQMREELHWLPTWWAEEGDVVWNGQDALTLQPGDEICPWGWSPALIRQLRRAGVADSFLPDEARMQHLRMLSHRQTAVEALAQWKRSGLDGAALVGNATLCHTMEEVQEAVAQYPEAMLKSPWSSSGRGLMKSSEPNVERWARNVLKQQGSVVVEEKLEKLTDFALEFYCDGQSGVQYRGLSLFYTDIHGSYQGNWVAPEQQKFQWLMQYVSPQTLMQIRQWWEAYLARVDYRGPVGVDMMLCRGGICPCVEINWRMTMGMVAVLLQQQGRYGRLVVEYEYGHYSAEVEGFG